MRAQIDQIRAGSGTRLPALELNALPDVTQITNDRVAALRQVCERVERLTVEQAAAMPHLPIGTVEEIVEEIVEKLSACHARWSISYFVFRELETFAHVATAFR